MFLVLLLLFVFNNTIETICISYFDRRVRVEGDVMRRMNLLLHNNTVKRRLTFEADTCLTSSDCLLFALLYHLRLSWRREFQGLISIRRAFLGMLCAWWTVSVSEYKKNCKLEHQNTSSISMNIRIQETL